MEKEKLTATFDRDSKRYQHFIIDEGQGIVGNIYIPKGEDIPDEVTIELRTRNDTNRK
jgi:hypothetical protein